MLSFPQKVDTIIRRLRPLERAKRHTLTLKCVNFVNFVNFWKEKSHRFRDGIFLFIRSRIYSSFRGPRKSLIFGERKNDGALISIHRNPLAKSLLTRGILERPKGIWNSRRLLERRAAPYPYSKMCNVCNLCNVLA